MHTPPPAQWILIAIGLLLFSSEPVTAQALSASLTPSDHNGFAVSCFGESDGSITANVTGGTPPYAYVWSHGDSVAQVSNLPAGYYKLIVLDSDTGRVAVDITLMQPPGLKVNLAPSLYPNDYNISCWNCFNGSLQTAVTGGVAPYQYEWNDGAVTSSRTGLGHKFGYMVVVVDANGCEVKSQRINLTQPDQEGWLKYGNSGTDPQQHFFGTSDEQDVVFKSNAAEVLRLKSNGDISLLGSLTGEGPLYRMADGTLRGGGIPDLPVLPAELCRTLSSFPYWETSGNAFSQLCPGVEPLLGTLGDMPLKVITNGEERMRILSTGQVAIGSIDAPETQLHVEGDLLVRGGTFGDLITRSNAEEGATLWARNTGAAWGLSIAPDGKGHILGDWNDPTPHVTFTYDRIEMPTRLIIGDVEPRDGYRLMVQEGILTERVKVAVRTSIEWSDHVFLPDYRLMPLTEVECFIQENGHLPGVPSAEQMVEQGLDVVRTDAMLLEKIEELTLYILEVDKRLNELEGQNQILRQALKH
ncbi:MAG: SprB repeat-containing protein [Flavobacteriales bacterium]|nr:SprB repeat-containing protein [Flavobacteriales bacterium]